MEHYDLAIVGGGIVGLAHALAAHRHGLRTVVIERETHCIGASIRNFGFITVTGQPWPETWQRARRSRDRWQEIAPKAGIEVIQSSLLVTARSLEAAAVLEQIKAHDIMGRELKLLSAAEAQDHLPQLRREGLVAALYSPHERRVESRTALPKLAAYLQQLGVAFRWRCQVHGIALPHLETSDGPLRATRCVVCPGDDLLTLYPEVLRPLRRVKLHMLRLANPGFRLPCALMADLSLVRYGGYAALPAAAALRERLERERAEALANGVHLIVVQSADGSLVVGDSHHYASSPDPFAPQHVDQIILDELQRELAFPPLISERWTGTYASAETPLLVHRPTSGVRLVVVTSGTGASTAFAIGEDVIDDLLEETSL